MYSTLIIPKEIWTWRIWSRWKSEE